MSPSNLIKRAAAEENKGQLSVFWTLPAMIFPPIKPKPWHVFTRTYFTATTFCHYFFPVFSHLFFIFKLKNWYFGILVLTFLIIFFRLLFKEFRDLRDGSLFIADLKLQNIKNRIKFIASTYFGVRFRIYFTNLWIRNR